MVATSAAIVGGIAAQESVKILHRGESGVSVNKFYWFDGEMGAFLTWVPPRKEECPAHRSMPDKSQILFEIPLGDAIKVTKERARKTLGCSEIEIRHDKEIVYSVFCKSCGHAQRISPCLIERFRRFLCSNCDSLATVPDDYTEDLRDEYPLESLHVPPNHLLYVVYEKENVVSEGWAISRNGETAWQ